MGVLACYKAETVRSCKTVGPNCFRQSIKHAFLNFETRQNLLFVNICLLRYRVEVESSSRLFNLQFVFFSWFVRAVFINLQGVNELHDKRVLCHLIAVIVKLLLFLLLIVRTQKIVDYTSVFCLLCYTSLMRDVVNACTSNFFLLQPQIKLLILLRWTDHVIVQSIKVSC